MENNKIVEFSFFDQSLVNRVVDFQEADESQKTKENQLAFKNEIKQIYKEKDLALKEEIANAESDELKNSLNKVLNKRLDL